MVGMVGCTVDESNGMVDMLAMAGIVGCTLQCTVDENNGMVHMLAMAHGRLHSG